MAYIVNCAKVCEGVCIFFISNSCWLCCSFSLFFFLFLMLARCYSIQSRTLSEMMIEMQRKLRVCKESKVDFILPFGYILFACFFALFFFSLWTDSVWLFTNSVYNSTICLHCPEIWMWIRALVIIILKWLNRSTIDLKLCLLAVPTTDRISSDSSKRVTVSLLAPFASAILFLFRYCY